MNDVLSGFNTSRPREDDLGAMIKDSNETVRGMALRQMYRSRQDELARRFNGQFSLERGPLAQHTDAVVAMLEDPFFAGAT